MTNENQSEQEVELLTPRTVLVPAELFDSGHAREYLAANGTPAAANDEVVWSDTSREVVAVMAIANSKLQITNSKLSAPEGDSRLRGNDDLEVCCTSPLLRPFRAEKPTVRLYIKAGLLYAQVYEATGDSRLHGNDNAPNGNHGTMSFAEVVPAPDDADILYFIERLGAAFALKKYELLLTGDYTKVQRKMLKHYFKGVRCE